MQKLCWLLILVLLIYDGVVNVGGLHICWVVSWGWLYRGSDDSGFYQGLIFLDIFECFFNEVEQIVVPKGFFF